MQMPSEIGNLVELFARNIDAYKAPGYKEAHLRVEFINPFFKALGWDVSNTQGAAEAYKDVIHEDAIRVGGATKAPDYCFRIGGTRKFFVETKKPAIDIKAERKGKATPAYQLRRYAWSARLPLSILTDFEEFAVYDCRIRPMQADTTSRARIVYFTYENYPDQWGEIADIFSRKAVIQGSFDKYAESARGKRGTSQVDAEFLKEIEGWRELLARNIALRNPGLRVRELNFAVQRTIDRIIFLRMAEDRGIEPYGQLQQLFNGTEIYARLRAIYDAADRRYNSGLFHFQKEKGRDQEPDELTPQLKIDDKALKQMFKRLYYPESPYEFSVLGGDILGNVYEQFLGKVISLTKNHRARVEEKPEVKKAGGVYYTPGYIVDYIVKNIVGKLCEGKTPRQVARLRILDPACGSGSFLIGAYTYLLDWHRDRYVEDGVEKHRNVLYQGLGEQWFLTTKEKKRILLNNIYGVDIDGQAVEVTKLNLLLKLLEGENQDTLTKQFQLFGERALPDLASNIKCGNSLIGPDFYELHQADLFDDDERYRINVFDWHSAFPEIFKGKNPGFDAVIGNPPYVRIQTLATNEIPYFGTKFETASGNYDIYCLFVEKGSALLKEEGRLSYILPHRFFKTDYGQGLRSLISKKKNLIEVLDFDGYKVFAKANNNTCIILLGKSPETETKICQIRATKKTEAEMAILLDDIEKDAGVSRDEAICGEMPQSELTSEPWVFVFPEERPLWEKLDSIDKRLGSVTTNIYQGLKTSADAIYIGEIVSENKPRSTILFGHDEKEYEIENDLIKPLIKGGNMKRYCISATTKRILFPYQAGKLIPDSQMKQQFPKAWEYLNLHKRYLESREKGKMKGSRWYAYGRSQALDIMWKPKIITPDYYAHASFCLDPEGIYFFCGGGAGGYGIIPNPELNIAFVSALLNSRLLDWYLKKISLRAYQTAFMYVKKYIRQLPIRPIDFSDPTDKTRHDRMVKLVKAMLELHRKLHAVRTPDEKTMIQRQIDATDKQIDALVYELYGLTEKEISIVEEATEK